MAKKVLYCVAIVCIISAICARNGIACVGRSIDMGYWDDPEQEVLSELVATFIRERTGSAVVIKKFSSYRALMQAVYQGNVSLAIGCLSYHLNGFAPPVEIAISQVYQDIKAKFKARKSWLLLPPLIKLVPGNSNNLDVNRIPALILTDKAVFKFPVLPRLLKKLSHHFEAHTLGYLQKQAKEMSLDKMAKAYLREEELI